MSGCGTGVVSVIVHFGDVDIPRALIEAQRDDRLVIFVGAGASCAPPSGLPLFKQLAEIIVANSGVSVRDEDLDYPDVLLGDIEDQHGVDVHQRTASLIGAETSRPNALHEAIAALAATCPQVRIVTTNYDRHLSEALTARGLSFDDSIAPGLPLGGDFTGVVYLHGHLNRPSRHLIVTDADFGQAYLRDAWAARFLERMFSEYTVLFIGYSHTDVVMTYLGRGLRPDSVRFVLTDVPDSARWRRLRIRPVSYPNSDGTHQAVTDAISRWASWSSMGLLDHRHQVEQLVATAPSQVPEDMSYLEAVVADDSTTGFFTEFAAGEDWLSWASTLPDFQSIFNPAAGASERIRILADWFTRRYVMDEHLSSLAWSMVSRAGGSLSANLWEQIGFHLHLRQEPRPAWLSRWLVLLAQNSYPSAAHWVEWALMKTDWPGERAAALTLFDMLTEPRVKIRPSFAAPATGHMEIELQGDRYWLDEVWAKVFVANLADAAQDLIVIADRQLRLAHALLTAVGGARPGWDPLSFLRSAIEKHEQDIMREPADVLIDAARDCLEALLDADSDLGAAYLALWAAADLPVLQRLAVHGWAHRRGADATTKLAWLRSSNWLFKASLRNEVLRLICLTAADAETTVADALVLDAEAGPSGSQDKELEAHDTLAWIAKAAPNLSSAHEALTRMRSVHPEFAQRQPADPATSLEEGWVRPRFLISPEELHARISSDAAGALRELREKTSDPGGAGWGDALSLISDTVRDQLGDGLALLSADSGSSPDIMRAVVRAWGAGSPDAATAEEIIAWLSESPLPAVSREIAELLADATNQARPTKWSEIPGARDLAARIWVVAGGEADDLHANDWAARALNHTAGQLAQFWVRAVASDWAAAGDTWTGLPAVTRTQLQVMLAEGDERAMMAEVILASKLHFFHRADPAWAKRYLLPLLEWGDPARARRTWDGFLTWGKFDDQLLGAGLRNQYVQAATRATQFPDRLQPQLYRHLSAIALYSNPDPAATGWARALTAATDVVVRTAWMRQVGRDLAGLPADRVEQHWLSWMRPYWQDRLHSIPSTPTIEETSAMTTWIVYLTDSFEEGVGLATAAPATISTRSRLLAKLTTAYIREAPVITAKLVAHLLRHTQQPFWDCDQIQRIVNDLKDTSAASADLTTIREQALRLGCVNSPNW